MNKEDIKEITYKDLMKIARYAKTKGLIKFNKPWIWRWKEKGFFKDKQEYLNNYPKNELVKIFKKNFDVIHPHIRQYLKNGSLGVNCEKHENAKLGVRSRISEAILSESFNSKIPKSDKSIKLVYQKKVKNKVARKLKIRRTSSVAIHNLNFQSEISVNCEMPPNIISELDKFVGLTDIKKQIQRFYSSLVINRAQKRSIGNASSNIKGYHMVFLGPPGTAKTTVARVIAKILFQFKIIKKDKIIETDRSGLVAKYLGQTENKTNEIIKRAMGGVLFIDEAYSLARGGDEDYGREAIDVLVKRMEDFRDRIVIIMAGYEDEMQQFISLNPGLKSRINYRFKFNHYNAEELRDILLYMAKSDNYNIYQDAVIIIKEHFDKICKNAGRDFGNGREVRNIWEGILEAHKERLSIKGKFKTIEFLTISKSDVQNALKVYTI